MGRDWVQWHGNYDAPGSELARRLEVVRRDLRRALSEAARDTDGPLRLVVLCAGEGRDVLPVLAAHEAGPRVNALLLELDATLAGRARATAERLGLAGVEVRVADAGALDTYLPLSPAHVLMACGVFGNVPVGDMRATVATLPALLAAGGIVIWTRGWHTGPQDPSLAIRACLAAHGFTEVAFTAEARYRVGMHRLSAPPAPVPPPLPDGRMFTFA